MTVTCKNRHQLVYDSAQEANKILAWLW